MAQHLHALHQHAVRKLGHNDHVIATSTDPKLKVHLLANKYLVGIHLQRDIHLSPHRTDKQKAEDGKQKYFQ